MRKYATNNDAVWRADLSRTSVLLTGLHGGFEPNESMLRTAELARVSLATRRPRLVSGEPRKLMPAEMRMLLGQKFVNPMLGIYGAHLMLMEAPINLPLFTEVVRNLRRLVTDHPDVEALALCAPSETSPSPFLHPPMLRRSWSLIVEASVTRPETLSETLGARRTLEVSDGPWYLWRAEPKVIERPIADDPFDLSEIEVALAEELGVMSDVRRSRERTRNRSQSGVRHEPVPQGTLRPLGIDDAPGAPPDGNFESGDREVSIDVVRMRAIAVRLGIPAAQLKQTLASIEQKFSATSEVRNVKFRWN